MWRPLLCGLLHNIGEVVIIQSIANVQNNELDHEAISQLYHQFDADFNKVVATEWGLPDIVTRGN